MTFGGQLKLHRAGERLLAQCCDPDQLVIVISLSKCERSSKAVTAITLMDRLLMNLAKSSQLQQHLLGEEQLVG